MAINLARHLKAPKPVILALEKTRKTIQDGLDMRRNRAIHGVQFLEGGNLLVEVHRGKGGRERKPLTEDELNSLGQEIYAATNELRTVLLAHIEELRAFTKAIQDQMRTAASEAASDAES